MKRTIVFLLILTLLAVSGCKQPAAEEDASYVYCGNTQTTLQYCDEFGNPGGESYTFMAGDSVNLTDLLRQLAYDPAKVCKCCCYDLMVTTEFGGPYYVSFSENYVRCQDGQVDLTPEQTEMIQEIAAKQCK